MNPFILLDYNAKMEFSPHKELRGVGVHPHSRFETVTIVYQEKVTHHDSRGNSGVIDPGDSQQTITLQSSSLKAPLRSITTNWFQPTISPYSKNKWNLLS